MGNFLLGISKHREFIRFIAMGIVFIGGIYIIFTSDESTRNFDCFLGLSCIIFSLFVIIYLLLIK